MPSPLQRQVAIVHLKEVAAVTDRSYRFNIGLAHRASLAEMSTRPAIVYGGGKAVTHAGLNGLANRVAAIFADRGIGRSDVVGIVHAKTPECYAAMLACLKLGAIYVNIDDQNPPARLAHIFAAARPKLIVGNELPQAVLAAAAAVRAGAFDFAAPADARRLAAAPEAERAESELVTGADPAYIMFTSGSTGVPKGAIMTHANVLNFAAWVKQRFELTPGDVFTNVNPMYFDNSVFDFYGALLNGAAIAPVTRDLLADAPALLAHLEAAAPTIWFSVPSLLIYLTTLKLLTADRLTTIRTFAFGGEGYPKPELRKLLETFGSRSRLVNVYGPTECTCICSAWDVSADDFAEPSGLVTLGPVAANFSMVVLDEHDRPVEPGAVGELGLMGPQVGLGYVNDALRTAAAFTNNPANALWLERMYRTGDLVRLGADGRRLDFIGRKDNQIKHMGYRIELEEIEAGLNQLEGVVQSAVLAVAGRRDVKLLVAYVSCPAEVGEAALRAGLATLLPPYMIPQRFELRRELPRNANGKVDRLALAREYEAAG